MAAKNKIMFLELQAVANGIGKHHDGTYIKEADATGKFPNNVMPIIIKSSEMH